MNQLKAVVFDFDGVLLESVDVKTRAFEKLFSQEKPAHLATIVDYHVRNGGISRFEKFRTIYRDILNRPLEEAEFQSLCERFASLVVDEVVVAPWVPGAQEFLDRNKGKYLFYVVSATPDAEIKEIVQRRQLQGYFAEVLGSPKTKTILLQELLQRHRLAPLEMVYIGDAINDWSAARAVGVPFIWRRAHAAIPFLPGYSGPHLYSLGSLENLLAQPLTNAST